MCLMHRSNYQFREISQIECRGPVVIRLIGPLLTSQPQKSWWPTKFIGTCKITKFSAGLRCKLNMAVCGLITATIRCTEGPRWLNYDLWLWAPVWFTNTEVPTYRTFLIDKRMKFVVSGINIIWFIGMGRGSQGGRRYSSKLCCGYWFWTDCGHKLRNVHFCAPVSGHMDVHLPVRRNA